jgi:hypothetical protein
LKNRIIPKFLLIILVLSIFTTSLTTTTSIQNANASTKEPSDPDKQSDIFNNSTTSQTTTPFQVAATATLAADSTLADTLNTIINNVNWLYGNSWTTNWAMILGGQNNAAFDYAITQDNLRGDYIDALYVARLAKLNNYASNIITTETQKALNQIAMCGSLPITSNAKSYGDPDLLNSGCFLVYNRNTLYGYQYATQYPTDPNLAIKWNSIQAFTDFAKAYDKKPIGSVAGEMLWCDPQENWAASYSSRYYDEHAQTLSTFLKFAQQGVPGAMAYADKAWTAVQTHWNGQYYGYTGTSIVECSMGNFAQVIAEYKTEKTKQGATIPYWDRVISDLNYKLLANSWTSSGWASPGVIIHAKGVNSQLRLWETMGATIALQTLFPDFTPTMKTNWANMLMGTSPAWKGLFTSSLNSGGFFSGVSGTATSNDATACAAATLFLDGIVPITGSLAIPFRNEHCNDQRTPFLASDFKFDYANRLIRIPVNAGQLSFIYGTTPISYTFPTNGVYTIQFSDNWNLITAVNGIPVTTNPPSAPQNLQATAGNTQVTLTWSPPASDGGATVSGYKIYKAAVSGQETPTFTVGNILTYTDTAVVNDQTYYYYITATNAQGESTVSNEISAKPTAPIIKSMIVDIKTDKTSYSRRATVTITTTATDSQSGSPILGASSRVTINTPGGKVLWTGSSSTNSNGIATLTYKLSSSAQIGTYSVTAAVTRTGYTTGSDQATFAVK